MKLRVVELLLVTTLPALVLAKKGVPSFGLTLATVIGGTLAAGAANAYNMVIESDLDKLMARTSKRPLVTGVRMEGVCENDTGPECPPPLPRHSCWHHYI